MVIVCFLLLAYARSSIGDIETYVRVVDGLDKDDVQSILKLHISIFFTYEIPPTSHSFKDIPEVVYTMGDHEGTLPINYFDISMKTKVSLTPFGGSFGTLRFDEKTFCILY